MISAPIEFYVDHGVYCPTCKIQAIECPCEADSYCLFGQEGVYSDWRGWLVKCFSSKKDAIEHATMLEEHLEKVRNDPGNIKGVFRDGYAGRRVQTEWADHEALRTDLDPRLWQSKYFPAPRGGTYGWPEYVILGA